MQHLPTYWRVIPFLGKNAKVAFVGGSYSHLSGGCFCLLGRKVFYLSEGAVCNGEITT